VTQVEKTVVRQRIGLRFESPRVTIRGVKPPTVVSRSERKLAMEADVFHFYLARLAQQRGCTPRVGCVHGQELAAVIKHELSRRTTDNLCVAVNTAIQKLPACLDFGRSANLLFDRPDVERERFNGARDIRPLAGPAGVVVFRASFL
jgi:hypothetical protein